MNDEHHHECGHDHEHGHEHGPVDAPKNIALNPNAKGNIETTLRIAGMDCADEVEALEQVFRPLKGVREVRVNLMGGKVTLFHDESVTPEQLIGAVASTGMKAASEGDAQSVVVVGHKPHAGCKGEVLGILAVGDAMRANAPEAIAALHRAGIAKIIMLSGDNQRTASAIAKRAGIDEAHGDLLPDQKIERVQALLATERYVGMIGDGVNDAPAMAAASVGIAMGGAGTDTAIETADMALMQDDLSKVAEAIAHGRRTVGIIRFNIAFALALKAIFLVLALLGHASLWLAILADTGATLLVIANALRLLRP